MWCFCTHCTVGCACLPIFRSDGAGDCHPWMKGTSGWSGDVTAPIQDAVEVSMGGEEGEQEGLGY